MAMKIRNERFPESVTRDGWFIPTDYIVPKGRFRADVTRMYLASMQAGSSVLDLNAGTGGFGNDLVAAGHAYTALEQNPALRDHLASRSLEARDWRPTTIPCPEGSADLVLSLAFIEHLPTWIDAFQQLREVYRVLKPSGRMLIVAPNMPGMGATFWIDYKHGWPVSRARLVGMAEDAGFEVASTRYSIGWITLGQGPVWALGRLIARAANAALNIPPLARLLEAVGLGALAGKIRKTIFELVAVELRKPAAPGTK
jgi:SAM-dependent methyltransferase